MTACERLTFTCTCRPRCLAELDELGLASETLLHDNAARILGLPAY